MLQIKVEVKEIRKVTSLSYLKLNTCQLLFHSHLFQSNIFHLHSTSLKEPKDPDVALPTSHTALAASYTVSTSNISDPGPDPSRWPKLHNCAFIILVLISEWYICTFRVWIFQQIEVEYAEACQNSPGDHTCNFCFRLLETRNSFNTHSSTKHSQENKKQLTI